MTEFNFTPEAINERLEEDTDVKDESENIEAGGSDLALIIMLMRLLVSGTPINETEQELIKAQIKHVERLDHLAKNVPDASPFSTSEMLKSMVSVTKEHLAYVNETIENIPPDEGTGVAKHIGILANNISNSIDNNAKKFSKIYKLMLLISDITDNDDE